MDNISLVAQKLRTGLALDPLQATYCQPAELSTQPPTLRGTLNSKWAQVTQQPTLDGKAMPSRS